MPSEPQARPVAIQLIQFSYDFNYEVTNDSEITYRADTLHRILPESSRMEVLVTITYRAQKQEEPVLQATCLTTYEIQDFPRQEQAERSEPAYIIPEPLGKLMTIEAIAHARALLAQQTGATPFYNSHVPLNINLQRAPGIPTVEIQQ